jgi:putative DNA methylase
MTYPIKTPKKLIEVALPLDDINIASSREKSIRHGHPSTLHLWWARRPLAAARAIIFAQMVNDPGYERHLGRGMNKKDAQIERERLFGILRKLVLWESTNNETVLEEARAEIWKSWQETCALNKSHPKASDLFNPEKLPAFHDPFAGGGTLPLEAQRLGLESFASDLNPVAVLINKAMIEIPPKVTGKLPIGPTQFKKKQTDLHEDWSGKKGLAEDIRRYGAWIGDAARKKLRDYYPKILVDNVGECDVVGWIWARTTTCPNPACRCTLPLLKSLQLTKKEGKQTFLVPKVKFISNIAEIYFDISYDKTSEAQGNVKRKHAECFACGTNILLKTLENRHGDDLFGEKLIAIVARTKQRKLFLPANPIHEEIAKKIPSVQSPSCKIDHWRSCTNCVVYGYENFEQLFTKRQLLSLTTYSDLVQELNKKVIDDGGTEEYSKYISLYITFAISRLADLNSSFATWINDLEAIGHVFTKQAIPMVWDFVECNPIDDKWSGQVDWVSRVVEISLDNYSNGYVFQRDAASECGDIINAVISTDPPYYDNIPYSNLADFFYLWIRRTLKHLYPDITLTISTPKDNELVANQFRHGGKEKAEIFFEDRMKSALKSMCDRHNSNFPVTIYYAFKQSETSSKGTSSVGWETFLSAVIDSGFAITGTWPVRTERGARSMSIGNNALASSIVLVCRKRESSNEIISRREFQKELREKMPEALESMIGGADGVSPIAPVDLAQAVIGPGMAIFSKYTAVLESDGSPMTVHDALILINRAVIEGDDNFDADTQFALSWFDEQGWSEGEFGKADVLARAKGTSVAGVAEAGVIESGAGKVRLLKWAQYPGDWSPEHDHRKPIWEALHHLVRVLNQQGESSAGSLLARMPERSEAIRQLAYRLYTLCERKGWAEDARAYNELIATWQEIHLAAVESGLKGEQHDIFS